MGYTFFSKWIFKRFPWQRDQFHWIGHVSKPYRKVLTHQNLIINKNGITKIRILDKKVQKNTEASNKTFTIGLYSKNPTHSNLRIFFLHLSTKYQFNLSKTVTCTTWRRITISPPEKSDWFGPSPRGFAWRLILKIRAGPYWEVRIGKVLFFIQIWGKCMSRTCDQCWIYGANKLGRLLWLRDIMNKCLLGVLWKSLYCFISVLYCYRSKIRSLSTRLPMVTSSIPLELE